jgi:hypothetical protein
LPRRFDPDDFDPGRFDNRFWNPYGLYELPPAVLNGSTEEWRRTWLQRRGGVDYWRAVAFPPQWRPVGGDDFRCDELVR